MRSRRRSSSNSPPDLPRGLRRSSVEAIRVKVTNQIALIALLLALRRPGRRHATGPRSGSTSSATRRASKGRVPDRAARASRTRASRSSIAGRRGPRGARGREPRGVEPALPGGPAARPVARSHARHLPVRAAGATSPRFRVARAATLFGPARRRRPSGSSRPSATARTSSPGRSHRRPATSTTRTRRSTRRRRYDGPDSDVILGSLAEADRRSGRRRGRLDRRRRLREVHAHDRLRRVAPVRRAARAGRARRRPTLEPEARFGLDWLDKAWDERDGCCSCRSASARATRRARSSATTTCGGCRRRDDALKGAANRYLRNRPVFRANAPGTPLPPNLAGRVAAAFALAAQLDAAAQPARAREELPPPRRSTAPPRPTTWQDVVTALPHAFYPESSWRDDLELGAAELALAAQALGDPRARRWLHAAALGAPTCGRARRRHAQPLRHQRARARRARARAAGAARPRRRGAAARRPRAPARARLERSPARPVPRRRDYDDFDAALAHVRPRGHGARSTARSPATVATTRSRPPSATGRSAPTPGAPR